MYRVRFYQDLFHPDHFRKGARGLRIRALNWIRWKLETYVQKQVTRYFAEQGDLSAHAASELMRSFSLDVRAEELEKDRTSPLHVRPEMPESARSERYVSSGIVAAVDDEAPVKIRPESLSNLIGQYAFPLRARKYAHGNKYRTTAPDDNFEPLELESVGSAESAGSDAGPRRAGDPGGGLPRTIVVELPAMEGNPSTPGGASG